MKIDRILVEGPDCSGKTTLVERIKNKFMWDSKALHHRHEDQFERYAKEYLSQKKTVFNRGALKIVYWASIEHHSANMFQEELENRIMNGRAKDDFSAFDLYQYVTKKKKSVLVGDRKSDSEYVRTRELKKLLSSTKKQIIIFSGNLSFINFKDEEMDYFSCFEDLVKKGVSLKVICRVDFAGRENIEKLLSLNFKYGKELVEIHHREQPLRALVIDNELISIKEVLEPLGKHKELGKKLVVIYYIKDKDWIEWMTKLFWKMFSTSIDANKRIEEISSII